MLCLLAKTDIPQFLVKLKQVALDVRAVLSEGGGSVDDHEEGEDEADEREGGQAVRPDVHALVVHHEEAAQDARRSIEIDAIAVSYR